MKDCKQGKQLTDQIQRERDGKIVLRRCQMKQEKQQKKCKVEVKAEQQDLADVIIKETLFETDYYFQNGLRKVYPYFYNFKTYAKERWFGLPLVSVFAKEFHSYSPEKLKKLMESQTITVNGSPVPVDYILKNGDLIENYVHRHELPVRADPIEIIADTNELLVVNKPSSIPIHPCGRYRFNSLLYILAKENGFRNLRGIYRLDRLTSGIVVLSKTESKTKEMMEQMQKHQLQKEYVCRVNGEFPSEQVECNEPIDALSYKLGIYRVGPNGKSSRTVFERMSFNGKTSVVKCKPVTGRTHQIRVHLQYLGFPIPNDPIYSGSVWGPNQGKGGDYEKSEEQLLVELEQRHSRTRYLDASATDNQLSAHHSDACVDSEGRPTDQLDADVSEPIQDGDKLEESSSTTFDPSRMTFDPECQDCQMPFRNPTPHSLTMYLHAYSYQGPDWCFRTALPRWAEDDWSE